MLKLFNEALDNKAMCPTQSESTDVKKNMKNDLN